MDDHQAKHRIELVNFAIEIWEDFSSPYHWIYCSKCSMHILHKELYFNMESNYETYSYCKKCMKDIFKGFEQALKLANIYNEMLLEDIIE